MQPARELIDKNLLTVISRYQNTVIENYSYFQNVESLNFTKSSN